MGTQELQLAILHDVTSRLGDVGKVQLQKIAYFLQEAFGVPTKFPFKMHHYGPYAEVLETNMAWLKLAGYVDVQPDVQGYGFHITATDEPPEEWWNLVQPYKDSIDRVMEHFGQRRTPELELAATIHYMKRLQPEIATTELLKRVRALKPKFDKSDVSNMHSELDKLDMLK